MNLQLRGPRPATFALALAALALTPAAAAASGDTSVALAAGPLAFVVAPVPGNFGGLTLNGTLQATTATIPTWSVSDATGSLLGWNVKVSATQFSTGGATPVTLPVGSMTYNAPSAVTPTSGQIGLVAPVAVAAPAIDGTVAQQIVTATAVNGTGTWQFTQGAGALTLSVPPTVKAGTYTSTLTATLSSGLS